MRCINKMGSNLLTCAWTCSLFQWDVDDQVTFPLATMSVVFTFIFVLEVSPLPPLNGIHRLHWASTCM